MGTSAFHAAGWIACGVFATIALAALTQNTASARNAHAYLKPQHPIATAAIPMIVSELMNSSRFTPDRERLQEEFKAKADELEAQINRFTEKYAGQTPNPEDPRVQEDYRQFQALRQQYTNLQQEAAVAYEKLAARQIVEAYKLACSAVQSVAEDLGYDYAIASIGEDEVLNAVDTSTAVRQMMARPMIHYPKATDITPDVRDELRL